MLKSFWLLNFFVICRSICHLSIEARSANCVRPQYFNIDRDTKYCKCETKGGQGDFRSVISRPNMFRRRNQEKAKSKPFNFPETIEGFGYYFNKNGQLRSMARDEPFHFEVKKNDPAYNERHYNALALAVEEHIFHLLSDEEGLEKVLIPLDAIENEAMSFIFMSKDIEKYDKILILIHGSGPVRAGQWTRRLIINHSLESGSQIPYVQEAKKREYGVIILNTNQNSDFRTGNGVVRGSESPENHFLYVWDKIIHPLKVKDIAIMGHSYGGCVVVDCALKRLGEIRDRVFAIAMSDSVHGSMNVGKSPESTCFKEWFKEHAMNWVTSGLPLDTHVNSPNDIDSRRVSAGTREHIETSWKAFSSIFSFFEGKLNQRLGARARLNRSFSAPTCPQATNVSHDLSPVSASLPPLSASLPEALTATGNSPGQRRSVTAQEAEADSFTDNSADVEPMSEDASSPLAVESNEPILNGAGRDSKEPVENEEPNPDAKITEV